MANTLAEKVKGGFDSIKLKNTIVKVPELRIRKSKDNRRKIQPKQNIPTSAIIGVILKAAEENKRKEAGKKISDTKQYKIIKDERQILENGGYGTLSKAYGSMIKTPYIDYAKLFSYLGNFKSKSAFEDFEAPTQLTNKVLEQGNKFYFLDREVIDAGVRTLKYFIPGEIVGEIHAVPVGVNSTDWEKFRLWQKVDPVMFHLKMNTI